MSSLYEIIELPNGEIALTRAEDDAPEGSEPLVSIKFSEESIHFLGESRLEIARAMIEAGLDTLSELSEAAATAEADVDGVLDELLDLDPQTIH